MLTVATVLHNEETHAHQIAKNLMQLQRHDQVKKVFVVDNASTDGTLDGIKRHLLSQEKIRWVQRTKNHLGEARRWALQNAQSPWLGFFDGDCLLPSDWVDEFVQQHSRGFGASVFAVGGGYRPAGPWREFYEGLFSSPLTHLYSVQTNYQQKISRQKVNHLPAGNTFYRVEPLVSRLELLDKCDRVGEDLVLSEEILKAGGELLLIATLQVEHVLPSRWRDWLKKVFTYAQGRVQQGLWFPTSYPLQFLLPLLGPILFLLLAVWAPMALIVFLGLYFLLLITLSTSAKSLLKGGALFCGLLATHTTYTVGVWFFTMTAVVRWLSRCTKDRLTLDDSQNNSMAGR